MRENGGTEDNSVNMLRPSIGSVVGKGKPEKGGSFRAINFKILSDTSVEMPGQHLAVRIQCRETWIHTGAHQCISAT